MNFLQLCKRTAQECGVSGGGPLATIGQTGESKRIVDWVATAWDDIQIRSETWNWMREGFSFTTTIGKRDYTDADVGLTDHANWSTEHLRVYKDSVADEYSLTYVEYDAYREVYMRGAIASGRPSFFTISPKDELLFYPTPNDVYTIYGDYYTTPVSLVNENDTPALPARFHMAIVYGAMLKYGFFESAQEVIQNASTNYQRLLRNIEQDQLPETIIAETLA